ncbi:PrsW family glutamic-type intramembrane protease [Enemella sp. A6]|uniref:PrsW family glutamic-type intramembrane protease n=1 Tax=Enemella sp. A6 TaxID=3440152 RepID=UPI003EBD7043
MKPDEPVASFALVSSIMPRGASQRPQTYRIALIVALAAALLTAIAGALPIAVMLAAFAIPIVYIVYIYDVNLWDDSPIPVTAMAFLLTGVLATGFTLLWTNLRSASPVTFGLGSSSSFSVTDFLLLCLLVPVVGEIIRQIGPLFLASRPRFDDLMDGLTFGVISGVAYACFDTIVKHWDLITGGFQGVDSAATWAALIFLEGFVKPLLMGTATGIACAEFSGLGEGYDGFSGRYFRGFAEAVLVNIAYQIGVYLLNMLPFGSLSVLLSVVWGLILLAVMILRVRNVLHTGLMEAAMEHHAREVETDDIIEYCPQCEMPVLEHASFCNACGAALRTGVKPHHKVGAAASTITTDEEAGA